MCIRDSLYDRLAHEDAAAVRAHLQADLDYQRGLVRFIENHDEPRAAAAFGPRARAAAVVMSTVPGARLYHDGQFEGRRTKIPVFLARGPVEPVDEDLRAFYARLVGIEVSDWRLEESTGGRTTRRAAISWRGPSPATSSSSTSATRPRRACSVSPRGPAPTC